MQRGGNMGILYSNVGWTRGRIRSKGCFSIAVIKLCRREELSPSLRGGGILPRAQRKEEVSEGLKGPRPARPPAPPQWRHNMRPPFQMSNALI